ncbi:unnamed protein product [Clonostachys chloroleuca]|uniref:AMP-dependent synthetase/ligase domain-containing protein n=1 Tax=Clonostachys chloroleuca TaxID=1926264 RepID=A0AA35QER1_9HYPO|nr:unnamed protein product [Clonostachys chloroleuca]
MGSSTVNGFKNPNALPPRQLLADMIDGLAISKPHAAYAYVPVSPNGYNEGYQKVSYRHFANMVNGLAWWLTAQIGKSTTLQALTYVGPNDLRQNAMIIACSKAGYKLLLVSPRSQCSALKSLLETVDCKAVLAADPCSAFARTFQQVGDFPIFQVPALENLMVEEFPHYPISKTFQESKHEALLVLHTSGTTATPKPITYTHEWAAAYMDALTVEPSPTTEPSWEFKDDHLRGTRLLIMMPAFHAANIFCTSFLAVACETTIILPPANFPCTVEAFIGAIESTEVDTAFIPPHLISHIALNPKYLDTVENRLGTIISGGGKIVESHGDAVASKVHTITLYGATEVGSVPDYSPTRNRMNPTWAYIHPHEHARWEFRRHHGTENTELHEAWITKGSDTAKEPPIFKVFPDLEEYCTRDLYVEHPELKGFWKWCGRLDDTICLSTGANLSPILMEDGLSRIPQLQAALMIGTGYRGSALLIEKRTPCEAAGLKEQLVAEIWPHVEDLNQHYFEDHRITRDRIIVVDTKKPVVRSLKGTIQRSATVALYKEELRSLFRDTT